MSESSCAVIAGVESASVDLHGLSVACAEVAVRAWLLHLEESMADGRRVKGPVCTIITGELQGASKGGLTERSPDVHTIINCKTFLLVLVIVVVSPFFLSLGASSTPSRASFVVGMVPRRLESVDRLKLVSKVDSKTRVSK